MFNRKSSYALNKKDPNAIVYMDANEAIIRLTREDFASEEEFLKWKSLSDADYHASEKEDHVYANHTLGFVLPDEADKLREFFAEHQDKPALENPSSAS